MAQVMAQGWNVDIAGARAIVERAVDAASSMRTAAIDVDTALHAVVDSLEGTASARAAQAFRSARRDDAPAAVRAVVEAVSAATGAADAFAVADVEMAAATTTAAGATTGALAR